MAYQTEDRYRLQYFTGVQASIWIGATWVTECFGISFQASQNVIPIFGYASSTFDAIAKGKVIIQGSFEINFVDEGYLYYVMHKMNAERIADPSEFNESKYLLDGEPQPISTIAEQLNIMHQMGRLPSDDEAKKISANVMQELASLKLNDADRVIKEIDIQRHIEKKAGLRNDSKSIIYDVIPFNIQGIFGNVELTREVTDKRLINCVLTSNEMLVASDDQPLRERYGFIGQVHK